MSPGGTSRIRPGSSPKIPPKIYQKILQEFFQNVIQEILQKFSGIRLDVLRSILLKDSPGCYHKILWKLYWKFPEKSPGRFSGKFIWKLPIFFFEKLILRFYLCSNGYSRTVLVNSFENSKIFQIPEGILPKFLLKIFWKYLLKYFQKYDNFFWRSLLDFSRRSSGISSRSYF